MNLLHTEFKKNGYNYRQVVRSEDKAIYEQSHPEITQIYYEVIRIKKAKKETEYFGKVYPIGSESYPSTEEFGIYGFVYMNYEKALEKYNKL